MPTNCWVSPELQRFTYNLIPGWTYCPQNQKHMHPFVVSWKHDTFSCRNPLKGGQALHPVITQHYPLQSPKSITKTCVLVWVLVGPRRTTDTQQLCACVCVHLCVCNYMYRYSDNHHCFPLWTTNEKCVKEHRCSVIK